MNMGVICTASCWWALWARGPLSHRYLKGEEPTAQRPAERTTWNPTLRAGRGRSHQNTPRPPHPAGRSKWSSFLTLWITERLVCYFVMYKLMKLRGVQVGWPIIYQPNWDTFESQRGSSYYTGTKDIHELGLCQGNWGVWLPGFRGLFSDGLFRFEEEKRRKKGKSVQITPPLIGWHNPNWKLSMWQGWFYTEIWLFWFFFPFYVLASGPLYTLFWGLLKSYCLCVLYLLIVILLKIKTEKIVKCLLIH